MKNIVQKLVLAAATVTSILAFNNCGQGFSARSIGVPGAAIGGSTSGGTTVATPTPGSNSVYVNKNTLPVVLGACGYANAPCVSVTVCVPGTNTCTQVNNILLDTGSTGLRVFKSVLGLNLTGLKNSAGNPYAECQGYIGGSSDWGPIALADVQLGSEKASGVPIQIIDSTFLNPPASCANLDVSPDSVGFNGILGVGSFVQDCGTACTNQTGLGIYYTCTNATCSGATMPLATQTTNPVSKMPFDNNGVIIQMPAVAAGGSASVTGTMYLGIGTQSNNTLSGLTVMAVDGYGNFKTQFDGKSYANSFIDSGSNAFFFSQPSAAIPVCASQTSFYCPSSPRSFSAVMVGADGAASKTVNFTIGDATPLLSANSAIAAAPLLGGPMDTNFDWGFSFFFGRTVVTSIENKATNLGTGPYWAF